MSRQHQAEMVARSRFKDQRSTLYGMLSMSFLPSKSTNLPSQNLLICRDVSNVRSTGRARAKHSDDQTLLAGVQAIPAWNSYFGAPSGQQLGLITASLCLPAIIFSFVGDYLCTRFGRKITVYIGSVLIIAGGLWNGMSQNVGQFVACKSCMM
jgi:hypothetical protein